MKNILVLEASLGQSHWKYSLKSGDEIIRRTVHRSKKRNIVDSWVLLDEGGGKKSQPLLQSKKKLSRFLIKV